MHAPMMNKPTYQPHSFSMQRSHTRTKSFTQCSACGMDLFVFAVTAHQWCTGSRIWNPIRPDIWIFLDLDSIAYRFPFNRIWIIQMK